MDAFFADVRHGLRLIRKSPGFALVTIVTLALGIGANTAIYSTVDAVVLGQLPYHEPDRLAMVWEDASAQSFPRNTPAPANYFSWKAMNRVFTDMAATRSMTAALTGDRTPEQVAGRAVTANFFSVLGVEPALGRAFTDDEERTAAPVVVISHGLWQRRYAADPGILGRDVLINGNRRSIIGVMPHAFLFRNREIDLWHPMNFSPADMAQRGSHFLNVVARLAPGVTFARASSDMHDVAARLTREFPETNSQIGAGVVPLKEDLLGKTSLQLTILLAAAGCVLLIACANIASLLLSRAMARRGEMAVRAAIGATRMRLVRQLLIEALVLSLAGGLLGVVLAPIGVRGLATMLPPTVLPPQGSALDPTLLVVALLLSLATGLLCSIIPALQTTRTSLDQTLRQGGRGGIGGGAIARDTLVVAQVAVALALLVGAGLLIRTLANLRGIDIGFRTEQLLTLRTSLPQARYGTPADRLAFYTRVLAGTRALPGVEHAAYASTLPFQSIGNTTAYRLDGRPVSMQDDALFRVGTVDYLKTIGVELVEGRLPDERDGADAPLVTVINETFARLHWPNVSAVGQRIGFTLPDGPWRTVIGVVKDVRERGYALEMKPGAYAVYEQVPNAWFPQSLVVRTSGDPLALAAAVRRVIAEVDPEQPVAALQTMDAIVDANVGDRTGQAILLGVFAALALLLATIGLYGVLSYAVTQRTREIGVRFALGASTGSIARLIVTRGLALTGLGLLIGVALAWSATRTMGALLYGVQSADPATFSTVIGLLLVIAIAACGLPALRASRVDPVNVLRQ